MKGYHLSSDPQGTKVSHTNIQELSGLAFCSYWVRLNPSEWSWEVVEDEVRELTKG